MLLVAVQLLGLSLYLGRGLSFLVAVTCTWALNRAYTFQEFSSTNRLLEWLRFLGANAVGGSINVGTYIFLVSKSEFVRNHPVIGVAIGSVNGLLVNFCLSKWFAFRQGTRGNVG
jgi:putative flippase GtrA